MLQDFDGPVLSELGRVISESQVFYQHVVSNFTHLGILKAYL